MHCSQARRLSAITADLSTSQLGFSPTDPEAANADSLAIGRSWAPRLKSSRNRIPDLRDTAIIHWIDWNPAKIPAQKFAPHK